MYLCATGVSVKKKKCMIIQITDYFCDEKKKSRNEKERSIFQDDIRVVSYQLC